MPPLSPSRRFDARLRGYSLIELMIALLIALFLLAGLVNVVGGTRLASTNQTSLAQLQDEERLAMSMINDVVQTAGYFDTSSNWSPITAFPSPITTSGTPASATLAVGQIIGGAHISLTTPDTLAVRYATTGTDGILNCNGSTNTTATIYTNFLFINTAATPNQLECSIDGTAADAVSLVPNVVNMQVWYGVSTAVAANSGVTNTDTYMTADEVTASGNWAGVASVRVTLTFNNPLYGQPGQAQYAYFTRVIALQARTGSNTAAVS